MNSSSSRKTMHPSSVLLCGLLLILNLQLCGTHPINTGFTGTDMDILTVLLHKLEESVSEQTQMNQRVPAEIESLVSMEDEVDEDQPQTGLDETQIREFLSAKNLKNLRNDSSKKTSGCFGRRMDRIGSMSSLGCNTIGRYNPK
ncbi:brain natriuretic peptide [Austrofundulus limnaeus]|uniref:Brain natriuretic peptide n=1 Tax=Austrofundulus limnaeus TaxID=52670 RepID=A0A2I4DBS2_AUSLI|nr:PREDICTED: natriuretic peptides B [Austrofundulus limnaeus]